MKEQIQARLARVRGDRDIAMLYCSVLVMVGAFSDFAYLAITVR